MARPLRVEFAGAVYHVMSRGVEGRRICADDGDRDRWLDVLDRVAGRFGWKVLAYCLLDNPVSKAVHGLVLGSDAFVKKVRKLVGARGSHPEVPHLGKLVRAEDLAGLIGRLGRKLRADPSAWRPGSRSDDPARAKYAYVARRLTGARLADLARALGYRNPSSVTVACRRVERSMRSAKFRREVEKLLAEAAANQ